MGATDKRREIEAKANIINERRKELKNNRPTPFKENKRTLGSGGITFSWREPVKLVQINNCEYVVKRQQL
ncbi:hypothetical protein T11_1885 [Trichinella zimbabwensis]|uniref:Uncharacterized protein n=1 Tax=Trichinella zimbabwensis TaxID=268475 RepID=A0A0V1HY69_9BILA|nr:hypothetical protein T11_1885 [Trichinella zimbabwensis]